MSAIEARPEALSNALPLDDRLYKLSEDEKIFFKSHTGIQDEKELKAHIIAVQRKAYEIFPYVCIRRFSFTELRVNRSPIYEHVVKLGRERDGAIFVDIGCCFGNDVRKVVADGWPAENVLASDLHPEFWALGHELFRSTSDTFPAAFVAGNIFDSAFLTPSLDRPSDAPQGAVDLSSLTSLNALKGRVSAIHTSRFFHLFPEPQQLQLARLLASLLSPAPGSTIFGRHVGFLKKETYRLEGQVKGLDMFGHDVGSWKKLWEEEVFAYGKVRVDAELVPERLEEGEDRKEEEWDGWELVWSVTRI